MPAKRGQFSRRRPWPYDLHIGDVKVMLKSGEDGNFIEQKTRSLDASAPTTFEYGSADPRIERTFPWTQLFLGLGQNIAPPAQVKSRQYRYTTRADLSIDGQWMKGPNFEDHVETINAGAGEVRQLIKALHGGVLTLFAICQNGVYRRISDGTWTASLTAGTAPALPGGQSPQQAVRFKGRYATPIDGLYVGTATGNIWQYTGATWVQAAAAAGPGIAAGTPQGECRYIEKVGDELWVAGDYWVVKVEANPLLRADYAGVIYVGDQSCKITWLRQIENTLFIFKEDGIYILTADGLDQELFLDLRTRLSPNNGKNSTAWMDQLWAPFGDQLYRLTSSGTLTPDGIELLLENSSQIQGKYVAGAGHNTWFFYEVHVNSGGNSYLIKHGSWITDGDAKATEYIQSAHHGTLAEWTKTASCCEIVSDVHPSGNDRLYVGFTNGTVEWCVLPASSPNPMLDGNCEFTFLPSYVYIPVHHSGFQADYKLFMGVSVFGQAMTNSEWAEIEYKTDLSNPLAAWVQLNPSQPKYTVSGQRLNFPANTYSKAMLFRVKLQKNPDPLISIARLSPAIDGIFIHEQIRPSLALDYTFTVLANSYLPKYNGQVDRRRGADIRDAVLNVCAAIGTTQFLLPDGESQELTVVDYKATLLPQQKRRDLAYEILVKAIQLVTITPGTTFSGLTYGTLEQYTYGELEAIL